MGVTRTTAIVNHGLTYVLPPVTLRTPEMDKPIPVQERIRYKDVMDLGFNEQLEDGDQAFFDEYGFDYTIITLDLTKTIYLDWSKETGLCEIVRINSRKDCDIMARRPIKDLAHLKEVVAFFLNKD